MADDNRSYKLNLDKLKGHQIELVDATETVTVNSAKTAKSGKSQRSSATKQTLKLKGKSNLDKLGENKTNKNVPERPKEWDKEINNSAIIQDLDFVGNDETKQQVANLIDKKEEIQAKVKESNIRNERGYREKDYNEREIRSRNERKSPGSADLPTLIDLPSVPGLPKMREREHFSLPEKERERERDLSSINEKGIGSFSKEISDINRRLEFISDTKDPDVRSNSSSKVMNFSPSFPKKDPIDSYSRVEIGGNSPEPRKQLSGRELHMEMTKELLKIERLKRRGYQPSRTYSIIDNYDDIKSERIRLEEIAGLESSIQFQKNGMLFVSSFIEMANGQYNNLFDLTLNGWSDSLNDNIDNFEPIFEELHEKYKDSVQLAPELKLIVAFVGSAVSYHFSQQLLKKAESSIPGFGAVMATNPGLKKQYTDTAAKMFAQNMIANDKKENDVSGGGGGAGDLLGGLLGGGSGGMGGMLSGLMGGGSTPAPVVSGVVSGGKTNNVQLKEPPDLDELLGDVGLSKLSEASLRVDDDLTSHVTGPGLRNIQTGSSRRTVKKR